MLRAAPATILLGLAPAPVAGSAPPPQVVVPVGEGGLTIAPADGRIEVDGVLDEPAWEGALRVPLPWEVQPRENAPAGVGTDCRLTYDRTALYLGCRADDPDPAAIRAWIVDRDAIDGHDRIVLTLDPFGDRRRGFRFGVSALGVQSDGVVAQQGIREEGGGGGGAGAPYDPSWDAAWTSAGRLTDGGYDVEMALPFSSLRFPPPERGSAWGVTLSRWHPRSDAVELRSGPVDRSDSCLLCQTQRVTGFEGIEPGRNVEVVPTLTAWRADRRAEGPGRGLVTGDPDAEVGLDVRWGIQPDVTLNLTVNPDFSQVEADVAQLDVNNRFALFFPERRPFFLEGADFFGTPIQAVFTRTIADPAAGAKLTGKLGAWGAGVLAARDERTTLLLPSPDGSRSVTLDGSSSVAIGRVRRDVGGSSTVGVLATVREGEGYHSGLAGVDWFLRPLPPLTVQGQYLRSDTRDPAEVQEEFDRGPRTDGGAARLHARWATRDWTFEANGLHRDPGFRADAGFVPQSGVTGGYVNGSRSWWGDDADSWYTRVRAAAGVWRTVDSSGTQLEGGVWFGLQYEGPAQTTVGLWPNLFMEQSVDGRSFGGLDQLHFDVASRPARELSFGLGGQVGETLDVANVARARYVLLQPRVTARVGRGAELSLRHGFQRLTTDAGRVFTANLSDLRMVYNFSTRSYLRTILQFRDVDRDPAAWRVAVDRRSRSLAAQILYAYTLEPRSVLFVGYGDERAGLTPADGGSTGLEPRARSFFLKLGWAWRP